MTAGATGGCFALEANFEPTAEAVEAAWDGATWRYARRYGVGRA